MYIIYHTILNCILVVLRLFFMNILRLNMTLARQQAKMNGDIIHQLRVSVTYHNSTRTQISEIQGLSKISIFL